MFNWYDIPTIPEDEGDALEEAVERLASNGKIPIDVTPQLLFVLARRNHRSSVQNSNQIRRLWIAVGGAAMAIATFAVQHHNIYNDVESLRQLVLAHLLGS